MISLIVGAAMAVDHARLIELDAKLDAARPSGADVVVVGVVDPEYARALRRHVDPDVAVVLLKNPGLYERELGVAARAWGSTWAVYAQLTGAGWEFHPVSVASTTSAAGGLPGALGHRVGVQGVVLGFGGVIGASRAFNERDQVEILLPGASPMATARVEWGGESVRFAIGAMSAPTFIHCVYVCHVPLVPLLLVSGGFLFGSDSVRAGPFAEIGVLDADVGMRFVWQGSPRLSGARSGIELRLEYLPVWGGRGALLYAWTAGPRPSRHHH